MNYYSALKGNENSEIYNTRKTYVPSHSGTGSTMETDREQRQTVIYSLNVKCLPHGYGWTFGPQLVILLGKLWTPLDVGLSCLSGKGTYGRAIR